MISERVTYTDSQGTQLVGVLSRPTDGYEMPVVIACHGFTSNKDRPTYLTLERDLIERGIAVFRFDFYGHHESGGEFAQITLTAAIDETIKAYELLKARWFAQIGLFWSSFGWCVALNAAAQLRDQLTCLVCKAPVSDYAKQKEESLWEQGMRDYEQQGYYLYRWSLRINYSFYEDMQHNNVHDKAEQITIPTLIVHGDADQVVKIEQSRKTHQLLPDSTLVEIEGAGHRFDQPEDARERIHALFAEFFVTHLDG